MKPVIALTMGDQNGIGPEVILKSLESRAVRAICSPLLIGRADVFKYYAHTLKLGAEFEHVETVPEEPLTRRIAVLDPGPPGRARIRPGSISVEGGNRSAVALEKAISLCLSGAVDGMVTAPVSKEAMFRSGYRYPGQTEMLAERTQSHNAAMMLIAGNFRVGLVTVHIPLKAVPRSITAEGIARTILAINHSLRQDFHIRSPKIAVLGLNPHAGERGHFGEEEDRKIRPAIERMRRMQIRAEGPFPADGFFGSAAQRRYDAVLAMYHDQGLIPLKLTGFKIGVNYSAGLPIVRTSPDHGTAFDIAGHGRADPGSMIEAIKLAVFIIKNRNRRQR